MSGRVAKLRVQQPARPARAGSAVYSRKPRASVHGAARYQLGAWPVRCDQPREKRAQHARIPTAVRVRACIVSAATSVRRRKSVSTTAEEYASLQKKAYKPALSPGRRQAQPSEGTGNRDRANAAYVKQNRESINRRTPWCVQCAVVCGAGVCGVVCAVCGVCGVCSVSCRSANPS